MDATRRARLQSVILEELSKFIPFEVKDPRVSHIVITQVDVTQDASHATVFFSKTGATEEETTACQKGLDSAAGFIRHHLAKVLTIRHVPTLVFKPDRGLENSLRVHELLNQISKTKPEDPKSS